MLHAMFAGQGSAPHAAWQIEHAGSPEGATLALTGATLNVRTTG